MKKYSVQLIIWLGTSALLILLIDRPQPQPRQKISHVPLLGKHLPGSEESEPKSDQPDEFVRYYNLIRTAEGENSPQYPANYRVAELEKALKQPGTSFRKSGKASTVTWTSRGPGNVGGRTRALIVDPDDATRMTWFAGSVGGGVWKTTDGGGSWINKSPGLANLATTVLAMAPSNHNILYLGTGEGFFNVDAVRGDGIWKSTDRGTTWTQIPSTAGNFDFSFVNRMLVDPTNENTVVVATNTGIFRSTNSGSSWTTGWSGVRVQHIVANPLNYRIQYASRNGFPPLKSYDAGTTWMSLSGVSVAGRGELAVAPSDTATVYLSVETNSATSDLFLSRDGGTTWRPTLSSSGSSPNWLNGQGWYDNAIAVHPWNRDVIFVGGLDIYKIQLDPATTLNTGISSVDLSNTSSFLNFVNWGGPFLGGGLGTGKQFLGETAFDTLDFVSVEVRFGPGLTQKAHRFVNVSGYQYRNYVDVPFQVWDITNNRQLMVSFRDSSAVSGVVLGTPGIFDLIPYDGTYLQREYVFIHGVAYNPTTPSPDIAVTGGHTYKNIYAFWPILPTGGTWNPNSFPNSYLRINFGNITTQFRTQTKLTDWRAGLSVPFVHADHHNLTIIPGTPPAFSILNANDGGVEYSSDSAITWQKTLNGYVTTQFYGADKAHNVDKYFGGLQDNGTWFSGANPSASSPWNLFSGGDGFDVSWHYDDPGKMISSVYYNSLYRSLDGGVTANASITDLLDVGSGKGGFITSIGKTNSDPDLVFVVGSSGVWRSDDFGENWTPAPIAASNLGFSSLRNIVSVSIKNPQIVWAGTRMSSNGRVNLSTNGGLSFSPTSLYPGAAWMVSGFATHPTQDSTAFALFSVVHAPKILRTTNLGTTWTDISGFGSNPASSNGFPDVATYSLLVMPNNPSEIWAGTEIGLFVSTDGGGSWAYANNGLPAVAVWQMRVVDDQVVVATHGRGVWSAVVAGLSSWQPPAVTLSPRLKKMAQGPSGSLTIPISLRSPYDSTVVYATGLRLPTIGPNDTPRDTIIAYPVTKLDTVTVMVRSYKNGVPYSSATRKAGVSVLAAPQGSYVDDMNAANSNYSLSGFTRATPGGFPNAACHTPHPYSNNSTYLLTLNVPIVVAPSNAFLRFDEIAIVEPGDPGSKFGDSNFWDYCIVEGSEDGITWTPFEDGYDCNFSADWLSAWNASASGSPSLVHKHTMNMLTKFNGGDSILIRFRMFTDGAATGWGWMIDNLEIQGSLTGVDQNAGVPTEFSLAQNFPNPFNPGTAIRFTIPTESDVTLKIYDALGRELVTLLSGKMGAGRYQQNWQAARFSSGVYFYRLEARATIGQAGVFVETKKLLLIK
ncbi:MAG: T9SS type A sorting domain-containing protein [Bacteroidota bacterium]